MNNDSSFIELTIPENLKKIDIDSQLKTIFINVMYRIQGYFNAHGYTKHFDYHSFLHKYLLDGKKLRRMRFKVTTKNKRQNRSFLGCYETYKNRILISKEGLKNREIEKVFCHEFIHFLTRHRLVYEEGMNVRNHEIYSGGFINEALTEMLTLEIYPEFKYFSSYCPQIKMMEFVNKMCKSINHYQSFLLGYVNINVAKGIEKTNNVHIYENNFYHFVTKYQKDNVSYRMVDALTSSDYLNAQRSIVLAVLESVSTFEDYFGFLKNLVDAPVPDTVFLEDQFKKKEEELINKVGNIHPSMRLQLANSLCKLRNWIMIFNETLFSLPFDGGSISFYDQDDWILYLNGRPNRNKSIVQGVYRSFKDGIYTFNYVVNNRSYSQVYDKIEQYNQLQRAYNEFKSILYYANMNFSVNASFEYNYSFENKPIEYVGKNRK